MRSLSGVMKSLTDRDLLMELREPQKGVFSTADLRTALAERHPAGFKRRIQALIDQGILFRFTRGFYVTEKFELSVLSQRIAPSSCISFATVLANELVIGTNPQRKVVATKTGRARKYTALGYEVEHVALSEELMFGSTIRDGVRFADIEKAVLDVLYFHLRGRRTAFDIYTDLNLEKLNNKRLLQYLRNYRNPKFVTFAKRTLKLV